MLCYSTAVAILFTSFSPRRLTGTWEANDVRVAVNFGNAGRHTLKWSDDKRQLIGARDSDGDPVTATRV